MNVKMIIGFKKISGKNIVIDNPNVLYVIEHCEDITIHIKIPNYILNIEDCKNVKLIYIDGFCYGNFDFVYRFRVTSKHSGRRMELIACKGHFTFLPYYNYKLFDNFLTFEIHELIILIDYSGRSKNKLFTKNENYISYFTCYNVEYLNSFLKTIRIIK